MMTLPIEVSRYVRLVLQRSLLLVLLVSVFCLVIGEWPWAKGLALGGVASAVNLFLMALFLPRLIGRRRGAAEGMSLLSLLVRFSVMGLALAVSLLSGGEVSVFATAAGLLSVQVVILGSRGFSGALGS